MKDVIEAAIKKLTKATEDATKAGDALQFSQAALNLAHSYAVMENAKKQ